MKTASYKLCKLKKGDAVPFALLLLADETEEAINKYIYDCDVYLLYTTEVTHPIGVFALYQINNWQIEIKNIAITESFRGRGAGSFLLREIKEIAREGNAKEVIVGTADAGRQQIHFYEKNGFKKFSVKANFFIENYQQPIFEEGVMLKDMIMLNFTLIDANER